MSWWDTKGFSNYATSALKSAQKKIDKVLDIQDDPDAASTGVTGVTSTPVSKKDETKKANTGDEFWGAWLNSPQKDDDEPSASLSKKIEDDSRKEKKKSVTPTSKKGSGMWNFMGFDADSRSSSKDEDDVFESAPELPQNKGKEEINIEQDSATVAPQKIGKRDEMKSINNKDITLEKDSSSVMPQKKGTADDLKTIMKDTCISFERDKAEIVEGTSDKEEVKISKTAEVVEISDAKESVSESSVDSSEVGLSKPATLNVDLSYEDDDSLQGWENDISNIVLEGSMYSSQTVSTVMQSTKSVPREQTEHKCEDKEVLGKENENKELEIDKRLEDAPKPIIELDLKVPESDNSGYDIVDREIEENRPSSLDQKVETVPDIYTVEQTAPDAQEEGWECEEDPLNMDSSMFNSTTKDKPENLLADSSSSSLASSGTTLPERREHLLSETSSEATLVDDPRDMELQCSTATNSSAGTLSSSGGTLDGSSYAQTLGDSISGSVSELASASVSELSTEVEVIKSSKDNDIEEKNTEDVEFNSEVICVKDEAEKQSETLDNDETNETVSYDVMDASVASESDPNMSSDTIKDSSETIDEKCKQLMNCSVGSEVSTASANSYVKNLLAEAMADVKGDEISVDDGSDKSSDLVKVESDQNSGHETSGDDIDTTTSSDIEIISNPSNNGELRERHYDLSPVRQPFGSKKVPFVIHRRTDSNSSTSEVSKMSDFDALSPTAETGRSRRAARSVSLEADDEDTNPLHTKKLLKKLADTAEILEIRERKVLDLSKENIDLREANNILRQQLLQIEDVRETEMSDLNALTEEFTVRIGEAEKKLVSAIRERDNLKKQLESAESELLQKHEDKKTKLLMEEKDQQIAELLAEGEKLSKQQLQANNIMKKLRAKEKENDSLIKSQKKRLEEQKAELAHLKLVLDSKEELEKKQTAAIGQLNTLANQQEKKLKNHQNEIEDYQEKARGLQQALDNSYREIAELHKANAAKESQLQEKALSSEMVAKEELRLQMEKQQHLTRRQQEALVHQIEDLRLTLSRAEKEYGRREELLRQEISDLQMRLQEADGRNQELTEGVTAATRPLLRQIENLQSSYAAQSASWERVERSLTERLGEAQTQLAEVNERERMANERVMELSSQVSGLESQVALLRQDKSRLTAQMEVERAKIESLEDQKNKESVILDNMKKEAADEINKVKREKILLENQLDLERSRMDVEKKRVVALQEQLRDMETRPLSRSSPAPPTHTRHSSQSSDTLASLGNISSTTQEEILDEALNGNRLSLYETMRQTGAANLLENLQSQLKLKEGEIQQLQTDISSLEKTRESMARELVTLTNTNEDLIEELKELKELKNSHSELNQRYNALLQMYGEKVEEAEELKLDLQDIKDMYKSQIQELLTR